MLLLRNFGSSVQVDATWLKSPTQAHTLIGTALSYDTRPCNAAPEEHEKEPKTQTWYPTAADPNSTEYLGMCHNKSNPWRPHLATHRTQKIDCEHPGTRQHRTPTEVLFLCLNESDSSLIHGLDLFLHIPEVVNWVENWGNWGGLELFFIFLRATVFAV